jgi:hypothetical protein
MQVPKADNNSLSVVIDHFWAIELSRMIWILLDDCPQMMEWSDVLI